MGETERLKMQAESAMTGDELGVGVKVGDTYRLTNSSTGGPVFVYVKDGKIVRMTPMDFDDSVDAPSWTIEARGQKFTPPRKTTVAQYTCGFKSMIYSDRRNLYPMKRVDWDPDGERNPQNRGISGYERITWDEMYDILVKEINRIRTEYGPASILSTPSSHHMWGNFGYRHSAYFRFMNLVGFSYADHNPDSWEGWHWGGMHMWGFSWRLGNPEQYDLLEDGLKNAEMIVMWSADPETNGGIYAAYESTIWRKWMKENLGVKMVYIDPHYNYSAALFADKWFSPKVGTDHALSFAIAYTWLTEGTYDKEYVATHAYGFEEWADYVLGKTDGQPKTCEWAEAESGVPACEIRALAREWAKKNTYLAAGGLGGWGGACRAGHGIEWTRGMIALGTMQGMGKPGSNMWSTTQGSPVDTTFFFPGYAEGGISGDCENSAAGFKFAWRMFDGRTTFPAPLNINTAAGQHVPRLRIPECLTLPEGKKFTWNGKGFCGGDIPHQMHKYEYPAPGYERCHMYWHYGGSHIGTMQEGNRYVKMYHDPRLECVVSESIWFEGEVPFADLILPACTNFERWDISEFANCSGYIPDNYIQCNHRVISLQDKCIQPVGESKSDFHIYCELADRLGIGPIYHEGKDELAWIEQYYNATDMPKYMTFDDFLKKGYFVVPVNPDRPKTVALRWFAEDRVKDTPDWGPRPNNQCGGKGLQTTTGKVEFIATSISRFEKEGYVDKYRPAMHSYVKPHEYENHKRYPLGMLSPHPRYSFHTMGDGKDSFMNDIRDHRMKVGDHYYWIIRMNKVDADARGIKEGDLVRAYNDRGSVILYAQVGQKVQPGTVHSYESCAEYQPVGTPGQSADRGGCVNILNPARWMSRYACGQCPNTAFIEVEKWNGDAYETGYPQFVTEGLEDA